MAQNRKNLTKKPNSPGEFLDYLDALLSDEVPSEVETNQSQKKHAQTQEQSNSTIYPYISYDNLRDIVVIDKQAYYKSSGNNSGGSMLGTWLPFIMTAGSKLYRQFDEGIYYPIDLHHPHQGKALPKRSCDQPYFSIDYIFAVQYVNYVTSGSSKDANVIDDISYLLIKVEAETLNPNMVDIDLEQLNTVFAACGCDINRICRKIDLINSLRLGGGIWENDLVREKALNLLTEEEKILANTPIQLMIKPVFITDDPNKINDWLIAHHANLISKISELNGLKKTNNTSQAKKDVRGLFFDNHNEKKGKTKDQISINTNTPTSNSSVNKNQ